MIPVLFHDRVNLFGVPVSTGSFTVDASFTYTSAIRFHAVGTPIGAAAFVQLDLGSSQSLSGVFVNHCTAGIVEVRADASNPPTTVRASINASTWPTSIATTTPAAPAKGGMDKHGIVKLRAVNYNANMLPVNYSARYIRLVDSGVNSALGNYPTRAVAPFAFARSLLSSRYEVGAFFAFKQARVFPRKPLAGGVRVSYTTPQADNVLLNQRPSPVSYGPPFASIELDFIVGRSPTDAYAAQIGALSGDDDIESIARLARAGLCWLDLGIADKPWLSWPVRFLDAEYTRRHGNAGKKMDMVTLKFQEIN